MPDADKLIDLLKRVLNTGHGGDEWNKLVKDIQDAIRAHSSEAEQRTHNS